MTIRAIASVSFVAPLSGQKSFANPFDLPPAGGRGRARDPRDVGFYLRRNMAVLWGAYVRARFSDREACAAHFGVTFQTACNWWDGANAPASAVYARASIEDGARLHAAMVGGMR